MTPLAWTLVLLTVALVLAYRRTSLTGFVMCEQVKSLDFRARGLKLIERAPQDVLEDVLAIIDASVF